MDAMQCNAIRFPFGSVFVELANAGPSQVDRSVWVVFLVKDGASKIHSK